MAVLLLENIRSIYNVGTIFRTADATGIEEIALVGYTPTPIDRMGRMNEKLHKTALGAEQTISWKTFKTTKEALQHYKAHTPYVIECTKQAKPYTETEYKNPLFIFGNEVEGVTEATRTLVQEHRYLPMQGIKKSLNVAVCTAVVLYHFEATKQ